MSTKKKRNILYYAMALACGLATTFFIISCSSDDYNIVESQTNENGTTQSQVISSRTLNGEYTLIDSIAYSDEFWEFQMSSKLLADKFQNYTSTLDQEEYDKLMESLNNDDYLEEFIIKANLKNELQQLNKAKEELLQHTAFLKLSEDERMQLFIQNAESSENTGVKLLKSREEGGSSNRCEEERQAAYAQAKSDYDSAIFKCTTNYCHVQASAKYDRNKDIANRNYKVCIQSRHL